MQIKVQIDSEIPEHIVNRVSSNACKLEEKLAIKHKLRFKKGSSKGKIKAGLTVQDSEKNPTDFVSHDISEGLAHYRTTTTQSDSEEDVDVRGKSIFGFQSSHKKATHMKKQKDSDQDRPRKVRPSTKRKQMESETKKTDYESKRRVKRKLEALKDDRQSSEENSSDEEEEEEDDEKEKEKGEDTTEGYERYFQDLHGSSRTSNNTLSKLQILEPQEFHDILEKAPKKHVEEIATLKEMQRQYFPQWYFELQSGFNLIFYGYGSKRNLLNEFAQSALKDGPLIVINGFFPAISIKDILAKIIIGALDVHSSIGTIDDQVSFICDYFAREDREYEKLYIMVHNLDGANLRNERTQMALSTLASGENIHLVASVDHINAGLLWDNIKSSRFNWIWHDATTFDDYLVETSFENSLLVRTSELGGSRGAKYVLDSLTSNAREVFKILAEHQLMEMEIANMESKGNETVGLSYGQYYQKCREGFYVSSDLALRTELTEFRDHKLISTKKTMDGTELFFIPLDKATLLNLLEQM